MSELRRLLDGGGDDFDRALLESARDADEDAARTARTLAALGLGPLGPAPGGGGGGSGGTGGGSIAPAAQVGGSALKWSAIAAVGVAAVIGGAVAIGPRAAPAPKQPAPELTTPMPGALASTQGEPRPTAPASATTDAPAPSASAPSPVASPAPAPSSAGSRRPPAPSGAATTDADPSALKREIAALDRVRGALNRNDTAAAARELARYDSEFPFGTLAPEAERLRKLIQKKKPASKIP